MIAQHIHQALAQVRELQNRVLEKQRFKGYSGSARILSGTIALTASCLLKSDWLPDTLWVHFCTWSAVFIFAFGINKVAIIYWFCTDSGVERDLRRLKPLLDLLGPLVAGGVLTLALILHSQYDLLFGTWMVLFGLMNMATRHNTPPSIVLGGLFYLICGTLCLLLPTISFLKPFPMGIVFFMGELLCGMILHFNGLPNWMKHPLHGES